MPTMSFPPKNCRSTANGKVRFFTVLLPCLFNALLFSATPAAAGGMFLCDEPRVFDAADVNALILPYRHTGDQNKTLSKTARKLSTLIQLEVLFSMIKYGNIGAAELVGSIDQCRMENVFNRVARDHGAGTLRPGKGLVLIWGKLYEEGDDIYVQTYMRFLRRDIEETLRYRLPGKDNKDIEFVGHLPSQVITFSPRRLTLEDIGRIASEFEAAAMMRRAPSMSSPGTPLKVYAGEPFSYSVIEVQGEWMLLQPTHGTPGWVRAHINAYDWPLRKKIPELAYLDGIVGYLSYQIKSKVLSDPYATRKWISDAFSSYEEFGGQRDFPLPKAVSHAIKAFLSFSEARDASSRLSAMNRAAPSFKESLDLIPHNADARNLYAMNQLYLGVHDTKAGIDLVNLVQSLLDALAVDPRNTDVIDNLTGVYEYLQNNPEKSVFPADEIKERLASVREIRDQIKKQK